MMFNTEKKHLSIISHKVNMAPGDGVQITLKIHKFKIWVAIITQVQLYPDLKGN